MNLKKIIPITALAIAFAVGALLALQYSGAIYNVHGLEVSQENYSISATWEKVECKEYLVAAFADGKLHEKALTEDENYTFSDIKPGKEYKIQVAARNANGNFSVEDTVEYKAKKVQKLDVSCSEGGTFTSDTFSIATEAKGKVTYESADEEIATVNKNGEVELTGDGTTEITVRAGGTEKLAETSLTVSVTSGETYEGEMPELPNAIASEAFKCAWPYGTAKSVYKYPSGNPTDYFKAAIDRVYPDHNHWGGTQPGKGASCDVYVGTVVRASGYDSTFPRALKGDYKYLPNSDKFERVSASEIQSGDIMLRKGHIQIYVEDENGVGYIANAHFKLKTYGIIEKKNPSLSRYTIYHPTGDCTAPLSEGEEGTDVEKAQKFLAWAGFYDEEADGNYDEGVTKATQAFQKASGTEETGNFGSTCISKAKKYAKNTIVINQEETL